MAITVKYAVTTPVEPVWGWSLEKAVEAHSTFRTMTFSHPPTAAEVARRILDGFPQDSLLLWCLEDRPLSADALVEHDVVVQIDPNLPREIVECCRFTHTTHLDTGRLKARVLIENLRDKLACEVGLTFDTRYSEGLLLSHLKAQLLNFQPVKIVHTYVRDHDSASANGVPTFLYADLNTLMLMLKPHDCRGTGEGSAYRLALLPVAGMNAGSLDGLLTRHATPQLQVDENCLAHLEDVDDEVALGWFCWKGRPPLIRLSLLQHAPHDYPCEAILGCKGMDALRLGLDPPNLRLVHKSRHLGRGFLARMKLGLVRGPSPLPHAGPGED